MPLTRYRSRKPGTNVEGHSFSSGTRDEVWFRTPGVLANDPAEYRHDVFGNLIRYDDYCNSESEHGWEIDHVQPVVEGGTDELANLQALHWRANRQKGDAWPWDARGAPLGGMLGKSCRIDS
ncbi:MAG: HNH endonuclease [Deltaproteobacteria bacterium]|nr:HNH endonuclease [Deltaproteobacteria bacterium]